VPVVKIGGEMIVGFNEAKLSTIVRFSGLSPSRDNTWVADRFDVILGRTIDTADQLRSDQLDGLFPQRRMTVRSHLLHILSFAEGGYRAHQTGTFDLNDMMAATASTAALKTSADICGYGETVRDDICTFLRTADTGTLERIVVSHYGGEVSVLEVLRILLRHSTHHLKQLHWYLETDLGVVLVKPLTADDLEGITVPADLFSV
jgi:uncharacterized damage-inducible protein DinB